MKKKHNALGEEQTQHCVAIRR